jgi:quinol monooxygenase YgiN
VINISLDKTVATLITVYEVEPADQQRLVDLLTTTYEQFMMHQPGFISAHVLKGQDGTRVVTYAQWESRAAVETVLHSNELWPTLIQLQRIGVADPWFYEIASTHTATDTHS